MVVLWFWLKSKCIILEGNFVHAELDLIFFLPQA